MAASVDLSTMLNAHKVEAKLEALVDAFSDLSPLMEALGSVLETQTSQRFETEIAPDDSRWKPSERARTNGEKTLTLSGLLRGSVHSIASVSKVEIGTNLPYAGVHQNGFSGSVTVPGHTRTIDEVFGRPLKSPLTVTVQSFERAMNMPKREFLGLSRDNVEEIIEEAEAFVVEQMGGLE